MNQSHLESSDINDSSLRPPSDTSQETEIPPLRLKSQISIDTLQRPLMQHCQQLGVLPSRGTQQILRPVAVSALEQQKRMLQESEHELNLLIQRRMAITDALYNSSFEAQGQGLGIFIPQLKQETVSLHAKVQRFVTDV